MTSSSSTTTTLFACVIGVLLLLVQPGVSDPLRDILGPIIAPVIGDVCKVVDCGKGHCKPTAGGFSFVCECDAGWRQALVQQDQDNLVDDVLKLLPCVIPNCTLDYSCGSSPPLTQPKSNMSIGSIFEPCTWAVCGEGTCNKTSAFTHDCLCKDGYHNLLNVTSFPCLKECSIGMDCNRLGIPIANNTHPPALPDQSSGYIWDKSIYLVITLIIYCSHMVLQ